MTLEFEESSIMKVICRGHVAASLIMLFPTNVQFVASTVFCRIPC